MNILPPAQRSAADAPLDQPHVEAGPASAELADTGLGALGLAFSLLGGRLDIERVTHEYLPQGVLASSEDLVRIARAEGFKARMSRSSVARLDQLPLPTIARRADGRFFLLGRRVAAGVLVGDAGGPPVEWSLEQLEREWTGEIIFIAARARNDVSSQLFGLRWFWPVVKRFRGILAEVLILSALLQLLGLAAPLFTQVVIDKVMVHNSLTTLDVLVIGLVAVVITEALLGFLRSYTFSHTTSRMDAILGAQLFGHLLALPIAWFESRATGQTVARVRELENIRNFLTSSTLTLVLDTVFGLIFLGVMAWYSLTLTFVVLASIPAYVVISLVVTPGLKARVDEKFRTGAATQSMLVENLAGIQTLKAMAVEPQLRRNWEMALAAYVSASFRAVSFGAAGSQMVSLVNKLTTAALLWFGAQAALEGSLTIGGFVAFNMLAGQISQPVIRLAQLWQDVQQFRLSIDRLGDILNTPTERAGGAAISNMPPIRGDAFFDKVTFRYKPGGPEILRDFSFTIRAGETIGVVGRSGSGKSTLTKLLQRLYVPEAGKVMIDGVDLALLDPAWLRRQIGVVLQENVLFSRTVRENIALANPALPIEAVVQAAQLAGAHDFILELPQGYDTLIEERGANLSGGQRQRIAIARALAVDPRIIIFDEATSALDHESERLVQTNMRAISQGRTLILVAHRLSTIRHADRIIVMDRGRIAEEGKHHDLIALGGIYASLVGQSEG